MAALGALVAFALILAAPAIAQEALPRPDPAVAEFARGVKFTVAGYTDTEVLTNFPVLVRLKEYNSATGEGIQGFLYSDFDYTDGTDLCFLDAGGNGIPFQIDTWDRTGESLVWVTLPRMTNNTEFIMWYHSAKSGKLISTGDPWSDYTGVWHMNDDGNGGVQLADATTNQLTATASSESYAQPIGRIGASRIATKDGTGKNAKCIEVSLADTAKKNAVNALNTSASGNAFSVALWIKPEVYSTGKDNPQSQYLVNRKVADTTGAWGLQYDYVVNTSYYNQFRLWASETSDTAVKKVTVPTTVIPQNTAACGNWYKLYVVYSGKTVTLYVNGTAASQSVTVSNPAANGSANLFLAGTSGSGTRQFRGEMDEVRLRAGAQSEAWVKADYDTVANTNFLTAGSVETVAIVEKPVFTMTLDDFGASHAQFTATVSSLGDEQAAACVLKSKVWPSSGQEPATWTQQATGLALGDSATFKAKGLSTATVYSYKLVVVNDEDVAADEITGSFTTTGVGVPGVGGSVTQVGDDWIHYFRAETDADSGEITNTYIFTPPSYATSVRALIVGGGGPGGYKAGGGGGAGGCIYNASVAITGGADYIVNVGTGGVASVSGGDYGTNGGDSSISGAGVNLVATGGGAGGNGENASFYAGVAGGSGGGSTWHQTSGGGGTSGIGNNGGVGNDQSALANRLAGGGGGAAAAGGDAVLTGGSRNPGTGGNGLSCDITGTAIFYAGGGGGGGGYYAAYAELAAAGGNGGGGTGSRKTKTGDIVAASAGVDGLGSGGGGGSGDQADYYQGADGGDGIVIVRYAAQGDDSSITAPIISLQSASCNDETFRGEVTFRVAWAGYGYNDANVRIAWGYSKNSLIHTTDILATNVIGYASGSFPLVADKCTVYCRAIAINGADISSESTETLSFYVAENENAQVETSVPVISEVGILHVDALYAVVTGVVNSAGASLSNPATCTVHVNIGSTENNLSSWTHETCGTGPFTINVTNLAENTTYHYNVEAVDDAGTSAETEAESFTTIHKASVLATPAQTTVQRTFTISGSLAVVGAGTTHVLVRWGDGEWTEVGAFNVESSDTAFSSTYTGTWDASVYGYLVCSNECRLADGTLAEAPYVTSLNWRFNPVDSATYTWRSVDGDWNGDWDDAAHWSSNKADCRGFPNDGSSVASFLNCTLANPVTVNVDGQYTVGDLKFYGSAASSVTFAGTSPAQSRLTAGQTGKQMQSNSTVEFRDMTLARNGIWEIMRDMPDRTNITVRFSNAESSGNAYFSLSTPFSRLEFLDGSVIVTASKFNFGGTNSVLVVDNSSVTNINNMHFNADAGRPGPLTMVLRGKKAEIVCLANCYIFTDGHSQGHGVTVVFEVPKGGYENAPIRMTSPSTTFDQGGGSGKFDFAVSPDSPALTASGAALNNMVMVDTQAGFTTGTIVEGIGTVPEHGGTPCGAFQWGVGGEPLAEGAALSTARQILLSLQGFGAGSPLVIIAK